MPSGPRATGGRSGQVLHSQCQQPLPALTIYRVCPAGKAKHAPRRPASYQHLIRRQPRHTGRPDSTSRHEVSGTFAAAEVPASFLPAEECSCDYAHRLPARRRSAGGEVIASSAGSLSMGSRGCLPAPWATSPGRHQESRTARPPSARSRADGRSRTSAHQPPPGTRAHPSPDRVPGGTRRAGNIPALSARPHGRDREVAGPSADAVRLFQRGLERQDLVRPCARNRCQPCLVAGGRWGRLVFDVEPQRRGRSAWRGVDDPVR
jgi:hypothetical protein